MVELKSSIGTYICVYNEKLNDLIYVISARQFRDFSKNFLAEYEISYGKKKYNVNFNNDQLISFKIFNLSDIKIRINIINKTTVSMTFMSPNGRYLDISILKNMNFMIYQYFF